MNGILLLMSLLVCGMGIAHAEPLEYVETSVLDYDGNHATVQMDWNFEEQARKYEVGCVSCVPNTVYFSEVNSFTMKNITAFPNSSNAMLYIIAYDSDDEIINAQQIIIDIKT